MIPGLGRCSRRKWQPIPVFLPGKSYGERGVWRAVFQRVTKSQTQLSDYKHACTQVTPEAKLCIQNYTRKYIDKIYLRVCLDMINLMKPSKNACPIQYSYHFKYFNPQQWTKIMFPSFMKVAF